LKFEVGVAEEYEQLMPFEKILFDFFLMNKHHKITILVKSFRLHRFSDNSQYVQNDVFVSEIRWGANS
jgi:hypothetical protein